MNWFKTYILLILLSFGPHLYAGLVYAPESEAQLQSAPWLQVPSEKEVLTELGDANRGGLRPESIKVLVWNLYKGKRSSWAEDYLMLSKDKDLLLLQEVFLDETMKQTFLFSRNYFYQNATSFIYKSGKVRTGVSTASTSLPVKTEFQKSKATEPIVGTPKVVLLTKYPLEGLDKNLLVINIHAVNMVSLESLKHQVLAAAKVIKHHHGPVVFAGDFNTWSESKVKMLKTTMQRFGLAEVQFSSQERMSFMGNVLDHVYVRGLQVVESKVWSQLSGSDHKALEVELCVSSESFCPEKVVAGL